MTDIAPPHPWRQFLHERHLDNDLSRSPWVDVAAVLAVTAVGYVVWGMFGSYAKALPEGFAILLALGRIWFATVYRTRPEQAAGVGTFALARGSLVPERAAEDSVPSGSVTAGRG